MERRSTGYGEVPYRGQPKPDDHKSRRKRPLSKREKRTSVITTVIFLFLMLLALIGGVCFLIWHDPEIAAGFFVVFVLFLMILIFQASFARKSKR